MVGLECFIRSYRGSFDEHVPDTPFFPVYP